MYAGTASDPTRSPARFRAATAVEHPSPDDVRLLALAAEQGRILAHLMEALGKEVKLRPHRQIWGIQRTAELWREGYELGETARAVLFPQQGPITDLPGLFRDLSIQVARVGLSTKKMDAASIWESDAVPVVLVNTRNHILRHTGAYRATLAHELCHLLHDAGERDMTTSVSWGFEGTGNYHDDVEVRARAFAPAFLAPRKDVRSWCEKLSQRSKRSSSSLVKALAEYWGLSFEGAAWHAKNCDIITPDNAERLARNKKKPAVSLDPFASSEDSCQPSMIHPDLPNEAAPIWRGLASAMVLEALEEGMISVGRARELLTWS
jgi:Zn-dependent peptidase ImmA (M78 family)